MTESLKEASTATAAISHEQSVPAETLATTSNNSTTESLTEGNATVSASTTATAVVSEAIESQAATSAPVQPTLSVVATGEKIIQEESVETKKASKKRNRAGGPKVPSLINAKFLKQECDERELREALAFMKSKENQLIPNRPELGPLKKLSKDALIHYCPSWALANLYSVVCNFRDQKNQNAPVFSKTQSLLVRAFKQCSSKNIAIAVKSLALDIKNLSSMKKDDVITAIVLHPQGSKVLEATLLLEDKQENEKKVSVASKPHQQQVSAPSASSKGIASGTKSVKSNILAHLLASSAKSDIKPKASQLHSTGLNRPKGAIGHPALLKKGSFYHDKVQPASHKHSSEKELAAEEELVEITSSDSASLTDSANSSVSNSTASSTNGKSDDLEQQIAEYEDEEEEEESGGAENEELQEQCAIDQTTGIPLSNEEYLETDAQEDENMFLDEEGEECDETETMYAEGMEEEDEVASEETSGALDEDEEEEEDDEDQEDDDEDQEEEDSEDIDDEEEEEDDEEEEIPLHRSKKVKHASGAAKNTKKVVKKKTHGKAQQQKKKKTAAKKQSSVKKNKKSHTARQKPKSASNRSRSHKTSRHGK